MAPFARVHLPAHLKPENRTGRPTEYRPEYCQLVIDRMSEGLSLTGFAGSIRVSRETVYEWIRRHSAFSDAVARGRAARVLWWELKLGRSRKGAETAASMFALRNAEPDEWRDVRAVQHTHDHKLEALTDAQLHAIAAGRAHTDSPTGPVIDGECSPIDTS